MRRPVHNSDNISVNSDPAHEVVVRVLTGYVVFVGILWLIFG